MVSYSAVQKADYWALWMAASSVEQWGVQQVVQTAMMTAVWKETSTVHLLGEMRPVYIPLERTSDFQ
jgi:hypothetical protein